MNTPRLFRFAFVATLFLFACAETPKKEVGPIDPALQNSMQGLKNQMDHLLPELIDPAYFGAPANRQHIRDEIAELERVSKNVTHSSAIKTSDPTLSFLSKGFQDEVHRSKEAFDQGHVEYARGNLLNVTSYCIECHTRSGNGPSFQSSEVEKTLKNLKPLDRGEYMLAMRQFDAALKEFNQVINKGVADGNNFFDLDRAISLALSITVRFQESPENSIKVVNTIIGASHMPYYLKTTAQVWKQSLQDWKKEPKKAKKDPLKLSRELVAKAHAKQQSRDDRAGDIEMMRVQALLHPLLATEKEPNRLGEVLFLTGIASEAIRDSAMGSLHEDYYEVCIRKVPHTDWSAKCYHRYEESVLMGYTGSAGTSVPEDVQKKMDDLQKMALPAGASAPTEKAAPTEKSAPDKH